MEWLIQSMFYHQRLTFYSHPTMILPNISSLSFAPGVARPTGIRQFFREFSLLLQLLPQFVENLGPWLFHSINQMEKANGSTPILFLQNYARISEDQKSYLNLILRLKMIKNHARLSSAPEELSFEHLIPVWDCIHDLMRAYQVPNDTEIRQPTPEGVRYSKAYYTKKFR